MEDMDMSIQNNLKKINSIKLEIPSNLDIKVTQWYMRKIMWNVKRENGVGGGKVLQKLKNQS